MAGQNSNKLGWLDSEGRVFGKINIVDAAVGLLLVLAIVGVVLIKSKGHITASHVAKADVDIKVYVQVSSLKTMKKDLFKPGETTSITIRNQPRGDVRIDTVKTEPYQVTLMGAGGRPVSVPDTSEPNSMNYYLTLLDHATETPDGYVTEGVKVKVGLPIELEGFDYRVTGKIVDVKAIKGDLKDVAADMPQVRH